MIVEKDPIYGNIYRFATKEEENQALEEIQKIISPHALMATFLPESIMSRGVQGDEGTYTRVILLSGSVYPDYEVLQEISTKITNAIPINKVVFEIIV